jgi:hypothetical protein
MILVEKLVLDCECDEVPNSVGVFSSYESAVAALLNEIRGSFQGGKVLSHTLVSHEWGNGKTGEFSILYSDGQTYDYIYHHVTLDKII